MAAPVIISSQATSTSSPNPDKPTGMVYISTELVTINGQRKAVQFPKKTKGYLFSFLLSANPAYIISMSNSFLNGKLALIHTATQTSLG